MWFNNLIFKIYDYDEYQFTDFLFVKNQKKISHLIKMRRLLMRRMELSYLTKKWKLTILGVT